ncbi:putative tat pathway signal sequence [Neofusicoccum parvum]|nr:putative tat pathway signal sequence [Neofusicoccum parvum]
MSQPITNGSANGAVAGKASSHTVTMLKRWSCQDKDLPSAQQIKSIHVYDFDNTLFASPLPNKQVWNGPTIGQLQSPDVFVNGGWWHDASILAATGEGVEKEEPKAWEGWWNEQIATLVELSMEQKDALTVLLTGRSEAPFADLIKRIVKAKKLEFDMVCLKPAVGPQNQKFANTMAFKQEFLRDLVYTYKEADEIRVYEDRPKHTKAFRDFFTNFNKALLSPDPPVSRKTITAEVIQVAENATSLDPVTEVAEVQRLINAHNTLVKTGQASAGVRPYQIKRTVFFTGYLLEPSVTEQLSAALLTNLPNRPDGELRVLANSILITPRPPPKSILDKVGGIGKIQRWRVTGTALFENRLWAARVSPVPANSRIYTENPTPTIVLALGRGAKPVDAGRIQNWQPVSDDKALEFDSTVGEKVLLRLEDERRGESEYESYFPGNRKRARPRDNDQMDINVNDKNAFPALGGGNRPQPPSQPAAYNSYNHHGGQQGQATYGGHNRDDNRRFSGNGPQQYRGGYQGRGRGGPHGGRGGRGGRGGPNAGRGGRPRPGHGQYKSLDDMSDKGPGGVGYDDGGYSY